MKTRFISDLHLDESSPDRCQGFFDYLDRIEGDTEELIILGDLFEAWVGDDDLSAFNLKIMQRLKVLTDKGIVLKIMHGNRDFLLAEEFMRRTGAQLISDPLCFDTGEGHMLLAHGDTFCTDDVDYQAFKAQIRSPETISYLLSQSLEDRKLLAASLRKDTSREVEGKSMEIMDVNDEAIKASFIENDLCSMIHGHTHKPNIHHYDIEGKACTRYVLGDWQSTGYEIILDTCRSPQTITLEEFDLKDQHVIRSQS